MQAKALTAIAGLLALASAIETHGGYDFEVFWDPNGPAETKPIKTFYQTESAKIASERLHARLKEQDYETECTKDAANMGNDLESLYRLKECIATENENAFFTILAEDIEKADAFWEKVIAESTAPRRKWVASRASVRCYFDGALTASQFAGWTSSPDADGALYLRANAEHYYKKTTEPAPLTQASHILEGWGGVLSPETGTFVTNFTVPEFRPRVFGVEPGYPLEWAINPLFGVQQRAGAKTLRSGTEWGILHTGVRDLLPLEGSTGKKGIEVYGAVWYPPWDESSEANQKEFKDKFLLDEDYQIVAEVINFSLRALEYCKDKSCSILTADEAGAED